uniref:ATP synthase complex subunit 8 n=1 Tax=Oreolalax omeimontis TaxID=445777 RepID=A0A7D5LHH3_9ANUR|nr:ATP synthase F0 subunit 8 [Oreolalax omeimontis]QLG90104.1 ATP synthase F0 subunit 8 [Oreolalax omeimontis]
MPQLNPSPWFFVLTLSWLIFLFIFTYKIKGIRLIQKPLIALTFSPEVYYWHWLWV